MSSVSIPPVGRSTNLITMDTFIPVTRGRLNNCSNTLCYTYNHNYVYMPSSGYGTVGTPAAGYLARRRRL